MSGKEMKRAAGVFIFTLILCGSAFAAVPEYEIDAVFDSAGHKITAREAVTFTNNTAEPLNEIFFHIYPHRAYTRKEVAFLYRYAGYFKINPYPGGFDKGGMQIQSISAEGKTAEYKIEGEDATILNVGLPAPLGPGSSVKIEIGFTVDIPHCFGRFGWHEDVATLNRWYPILSVRDKDGWHNYPFYLYHQPFFSDASLYKVKLTLPADETAAHTGQLIQEEDNGNGTKSLFIETGLPVRDFSLGISRSFKVYAREENGVTIKSFYLPGDEASARDACDFARDTMDFYGKLFGSYPYKEFSVVPSYLGYGGHESSNLVFIDTRAYKLPGFLIRYFDFLVSHETGHQWFYNVVGSDEYKETFLDEGLNSYWMLKYVEEKYGKDAQVMVLPNPVKWLIPNFSFRDSRIARYNFLVKNGYDRPILGKLSSFQEPSSIFALTYGKGSAVISMLSALMGDEVFVKAIQAYTGDFKFKNAGVDDFIKICEGQSGRDLGWFFDQWLKTDKQCDYAVSLVSGKSVLLERKGRIQMPVEVKAGLSGGREETLTWDGEDPVQILDFSEDVESARLDPGGSMLDIDRTNNVWPRRLYLKPVPVYFFAYEIPVFLKPDGYNLVAGPDLSNALGFKASLQKPEDDILYIKSGYDFNSESVKSTLGYQFKHIGGSHLAAGFEFFNWESNHKEEDLTGGKIYLRRELWPAPYGLGEINDHVTVYMIRDRKFEGLSTLSGTEDSEHLYYRRKDETIFGIEGTLARRGPYPDHVCGWSFTPTQEFGVHALGGTESFWRSALELDSYRFVSAGSKLAGRLKLGWGEAHDKRLFQLGGDEGLRGYDRKTVNGSRMLLTSIEYRATVLDDLGLYCFDNLLHLDEIQLVPFFDIGKAWFASFNDSDFKKDLGLGFRFYVDIAGFVERLGIRLDVARAIDDPDEDQTRLWLGANHAF
ncbi:MAG: M1 family aminopeptidase [Candidatus Omnitrophica bacterium]|nr:M1 family aminopeptidase [Candidatus Omnitrophota bacterium]